MMISFSKKISTRIYGSLGLILALMLSLGILAFVQTQRLWQNNEGLYEHPLMVKRALYEFNSDVFEMHLLSHELTGNGPGMNSLLERIAGLENDARRQVRILYGHYLGPAGDIDDIRNKFDAWISLRAETIRLPGEGKVDEARRRIGSGGVDSRITAGLLNETKDISDFSINKADYFFRESRKEKDQLVFRGVSLTGLAILLSVIIALLLVRSLMVPLQELLITIGIYRLGDRNIVCRHVAEDEFGILISQFNEMVKDIERTTRHLELANKELESFSYSVAHDLRAPLRSVEGFSNAVLEEYADKLDDRGRDYLQRINAASVTMAGLIDDLLNLSRTGRQEMAVKPVDLSAIAHRICTDFQRLFPERAVKLVIEDHITANGDGALLRIVLQNLLANAWKFTGKHASGTIEFGAMDLNGERVYFVRDDGAGFDMAYASKLFEVFARLHSRSEFEGTGIGLTIARRIVARHDGRIWAESPGEGKGATVYFTLGPGQEKRT